MVLRLPGSWHRKDPNFFLLIAVLFTTVAPLVGVARKILAAGTKFRDTSMAGPLGGAADRSGSDHHRSWRRRWWAPWGVLPAGPAAATTGVGDVDGGPLGVLPAGPTVATTRVGDVDGGSTGRCCRQVRQRPSSELATSMADPLGGAAGRYDSGHHRSWRRRWRPP
jgi:hypothetical protein